MGKKSIHHIKIENLRYPDKGIAFLGDQEVIVRHSLPGQLVEAECGRKRRQKVGRVLQVLQPAPQEISTPCPDFGKCGGCTFLNIPYEYELQLKQQMLQPLLKDFWDGDIPIIPAPSTVGYRNKMEFSFGDSGRDGPLALGIRKRNSHYEVAVPNDCQLIPNDFKTITLATLDYFDKTNETFYHRMRHTGTLRYLVLRRGEFTGELLVNLVTTDSIEPIHITKWTETMQALNLEAQITGILHTTSNSLSDAVVPEDVKTLYGRDYFYEKICGLSFRISPFSFFQTYSGGAELLYSTVAEFVTDCGKISEKLFDLYCGTGTIAQVLASHAKEVIGVELVPEAMDAAKENAHANGISNCQFIAGDVLKIIDDYEFVKPDVMVLDPPRDGIHPKALPKLIALGASKVVYVSCKPTSLARDLPMFLEAGYKVKAMRAHDMFPRTPHVEVVCLLEL